MAKVIYDHVTKRFGDVTAISDLSFEVEDKEFLVLVGPSGCGKSTALRMLAGLEEITEGEIRIGDRVVNDVQPKDRDIAMVFQSYALYPHMTVFDNMGFGLKLRGAPKEEIERRVNEAAQTLGITPLLDRRPRQLSGGQRQRVAVGRAIVRDPAVFLMDEPLSNLDAKLRVQARAEIVKIHQRLETTFIYVTHDQTEAMTMGSRIAVLKDGLLQQIDTPQNLYDYPDNVFVGGFIGSPAMNFFDGKLIESNGDLTVDVGPFQVPLPKDLMEPAQPYKGQDVVMGIRPEDIHDPDYVPAKVKEQSVPARVEVTELMGNEVFLNLSTDDLAYVARVDPRTSAKMGKDMSVVMNVDNVHIFDADTEEAIR